VFARFKELADRKLELADADIEAIAAEELGVTESDSFLLESLHVAGGTHLSPTATVRLRRNGSVLEDSAMGDGMIDAACAAIARACGLEGARLVHFNVSSVTEGTDALGDVVVQLEVNGKPFTGRGVSSDVVEASARAYLSALNRAVRAADNEGGR
jgi:2-isopropylmalate synthase